MAGCAAGSSWNASMCDQHTTPSATPASEALLVTDKQVQPLSRNEVINGIKECETSGLRAAMITSKRKINGYTSDVVIDITCMPKY